MADNIAVTEGAGKTVATDDVGGTQYQRIKVDLGGDGVAVPLVAGQAAMAASIPVVIASNQASVPVNQVSQAFDVAATVTRAANQTPYTANDVVGGVLSFPLIGANASSLLLTGVQLEFDITAVPSGMAAFKLALYTVTPPSALADNAAFDIPSGDRSSFVGIIDIAVPVDYGATLYVENNNIGKQLKLTGTGLFGYLITTGTYIPAANSEVGKVTLHSVLV